MKVRTNLNGEEIVLEAEPLDSVMTVLRRQKCYSVKCGCSKGICGNCMILLDGKAVPSCQIPFCMIRERSIETLEHFKKNPIYQYIMAGFNQVGIQLCGYCDAGKIFTAYEYLKNNTSPEKHLLSMAIESLDCCCTDQDSLARGIQAALSIKIINEGKHANGKK